MDIVSCIFFLQREGWHVNHKRLCRLYCEEGLSIRTHSPKRRHACRYRSGRSEVDGMNNVWAMDFISDRLFDEKPFRILTILDCFTREALATAARTNFQAYQVIDELDFLRPGRPTGPTNTSISVSSLGSPACGKCLGATTDVMNNGSEWIERIPVKSGFGRTCP